MKTYSLMTSVDKSLFSRAIVMPLLFAVALLLYGCQDSQLVHSFSGQTMGTYWHVSMAESLNQEEKKVISATIEQTLGRVNQSMSTYIPDSEISLFNQAKAAKSYKLSHEILTVIDAALMLSEQTGGRYDITIAPLVNLWGFGPDETSQAPDKQKIQEMLARVGYQGLIRSDDGLIKSNDGMMIDLSSIAKGYGVDRVAQSLSDLGYKNFLVEIGGEVVAYGDKFGSSWRVGVEKPANGREVQSVIELRGEHTAIASSGNYRNYIDYDGERAVHTIDPKTGYPVRNTLLSTTIISDSCMMADAYATALMVLDEEAPDFANRHGLAAVMIYSNGEGFKVVHSEQYRRQFGEE